MTCHMVIFHLAFLVGVALFLVTIKLIELGA